MPAQRVQFINLPTYPTVSQLSGSQQAQRIQEYFKNHTSALTYFANQVTQAVDNGLLPTQAVTTLTANASATAVVVTFASAVQAGLTYGVAMMPTWNTTWWVTPSNFVSFTLNFGTPPNVTTTFGIMVWLSALPA